jgi:hypothetical protein
VLILALFYLALGFGYLLRPLMVGLGDAKPGLKPDQLS